MINLKVFGKYPFQKVWISFQHALTPFQNAETPFESTETQTAQSRISLASTETDCKQELQAGIASRNCQQKLQAEIASKIWIQTRPALLVKKANNEAY